MSWHAEEDMSNQKKDILISIINGNTRGYIYKSVESIIEHTSDVSYDIVVIDNCTGDPDLAQLESMGVKVIINKEPMGFAENHSQALNYLDNYDYLALFNDDAFTDNNVFKIMTDAINDENDVPIAGCHIADPDGSLQPTAAPFPTLSYFIKNVIGFDQKKGNRYSDFFTSYIDFEKTQYVDWVSGCCMLIKSDFIKRHGFMDTGYFMFLEDADLCKRAHQNNMKVKYVSEARVTHLQGGSSKSSTGQIKPFLYIETQRSRLRYLRKNSIISYLSYLFFINTIIGIKLIKCMFDGRKDWAKDVVRRIRLKPLL